MIMHVHVAYLCVSKKNIQKNTTQVFLYVYVYIYINYKNS